MCSPYAPQPSVIPSLVAVNFANIVAVAQVNAAYVSDTAQFLFQGELGLEKGVQSGRIRNSKSGFHPMHKVIAAGWICNFGEPDGESMR